MNVFEVVKQSVTTRQAAEHYGIKVNRNGMCVCPFHNDKNPSMKVDRRFYCFGCGATGDVIDFVSRLHGIGSKEAALMLAQDFSIPYERSRKLFKARISALFLFLFFISSSILRKRNFIFLKKLLTYAPKCAGAFGDHIRQSPNAPLIGITVCAPRTAQKLQGGPHYDQATGSPCKITSTFSPNPKPISIPLKGTSSIRSFGRPGQAVPHPLGGQAQRRPCSCRPYRLHYELPAAPRFLF